MATKKVAKKAPKKVAKKAPAKKAAPKFSKDDEFVVIKESCSNLISAQTECYEDALETAKDSAKSEFGEKFIVAKLAPVTSFEVPDSIIVEDL